jgi:hypothetical protein
MIVDGKLEPCWVCGEWMLEVQLNERRECEGCQFDDVREYDFDA